MPKMPLAAGHRSATHTCRMTLAEDTYLQWMRTLLTPPPSIHPYPSSPWSFSQHVISIHQQRTSNSTAQNLGTPRVTNNLELWPTEQACGIAIIDIVITHGRVNSHRWVLNAHVRLS